MINTKYYTQTMRALALEAMRRTRNGEDSVVHLSLIGLCVQAIEGDNKAIEVLKNKGIHPEEGELFQENPA